jgi:hypothetical protein
MITLIVVTALLTPSVLIVSACMLSSRLSQEEGVVEHYEASKASQSMGLVSVSSRN